MTQDNPQVPWTDDQWDRVTQAIQDEANRARVAAAFLPLYGPLPPDTDFVRKNVLETVAQPQGMRPERRLTIDDTNTIALATLQVKVFLRGAQMADPNLTSALQMLRRAANILSRLEDAVVFNGLTPSVGPPEHARDGLPAVWEVLGGQSSTGLMGNNPPSGEGNKTDGNGLVEAVSSAIGRLEGRGQFGPFGLVLDHLFFTAVQTPNDNSLVLPQDRIIPFLGGGSLHRSSTLPKYSGVVVALAGAPVELVVATDVTLNLLQVTTDPMYAFRVFEKIALRIKEQAAIEHIVKPHTGPPPSPPSRGRKNE
jgi:uncharacterized linocin/CFP29 family protein